MEYIITFYNSTEIVWLQRDKINNILITKIKRKPYVLIGRFTIKFQLLPNYLNILFNKYNKIRINNFNNFDIIKRVNSWDDLIESLVYLKLEIHYSDNSISSYQNLCFSKRYLSNLL
jgi:hypothetical protein